MDLNWLDRRLNGGPSSIDLQQIRLSEPFTHLHITHTSNNNKNWPLTAYMNTKTNSSSNNNNNKSTVNTNGLFNAEYALSIGLEDVFGSIHEDCRCLWDSHKATRSNDRFETLLDN